MYDCTHGFTHEPRASVSPPVTAAWQRLVPVLASCVVMAQVTSLAVVCLVTPGRATAASDLVPHEALYELTLHPSSRGSDVSALRGRMKLRFEASCDGWGMQQSLAFRMLAQGDARLEHLAHFNAFEETGGSAFTFNARTWEDRELVEALAGKAGRRPGGSVEVDFVQPEARSETLPVGTLFPVEHIQAVLAAAHAGRRFGMHTVFDGSSTESPFQISSVIGVPAHGPPGVPEVLKGTMAWPVRLAYFPPGAVEPGADFEMGVTLFANGVAGNMVYDYGDFAIDVRLTQVVVLESPDCD